MSDIFYATIQESQACQGHGEAIISAVEGGCIQTISRLLQQGAPLDIQDFVCLVTICTNTYINFDIHHFFDSS